MKQLISACILIVSVVCANEMGIHYEKTLRGNKAQVLELEYHLMTRSQSEVQGKKSLAFPKTCEESAQKCVPDLHLKWESDSSHWVELGGEWAYEYRNLDIEGGNQTDFGRVESGKNIGVSSQTPAIKLRSQYGSLSSWADVRIYGEDHERFTGSWDHQFIEVQEEGKNSNLNFVSYSRFIGGLSYASPIGHFAAGRHSIHWGPSLRYPLLFGSNAPPMNNLSYQIHLGPFTVTSLFAELDIGSQGRFTASRDSRTVYGHRYEWRIHPQWTLAMSENLILYELAEPFAFVPVFPLFMYKGQTREPDNNGNLNFDLSFWLPPFFRAYGEFLIDDMSEPSSLFDNFSGNKWGGTLGAQFAFETKQWEWGLIGEWTHIEPYVYSHYVARTAQATHFDIPIGNPLGPNAMGIFWKSYARYQKWYLGLAQEWIWKGSDFGSSAEDALPNNEVVRKSFLRTKKPVEYILSPELWYTREFFSAQIWADLEVLNQKKSNWYLRFSFKY